MPLTSSSSANRGVARTRARSIRLAQSALETALSELSSPSRRRVREAGLGSRPVLRVNADVLARATPPTITFATSKQGKLKFPQSSLRGIARHEVAHFSLPGTKKGRFFGHHFALQAAGARGEFLAVPSGVVLRRSESAFRLPSSRKIGFAMKHRRVNTLRSGKRR